MQISFVIQAQRQLREFGVNQAYSGPIIKEPTRRIVHSALPTYQNIWDLLEQVSRTTRRIKQQLACSSQPRPSEDAELNSVIDQAFAMYVAVLHWPQTVREKDRYHSIPAVDTQSDSPQYPLTHHTFDSFQHGALWVGFWCAKIQYLQQFKLLLNVYSDVHFLNARWTASLKDQIMKNISAAIDHICGMAGYMLGEGVGSDAKVQSSLGAFFLLRGFYVVSQVDTVTSEQKAFVASQLSRIGRLHGIELALRFRERLLAS